MNEVLISVISIVIISLTIVFFLAALPINLKEDNKLKLLGKIIRFTKENNKYRTIAYVIFPFVSLYALFFISYYQNFYDNGEIDYFFSAIHSLIATVKSLVFETDLSPIETLFKNIPAYRLAWLIHYPYALIFVYATIINTLTDSIKNAFIVNRKLKKNCDIVIGLKDLKSYGKNGENVIAWVEEDISKDDEKTLKSYKIPYIKKTFTVENLNKIKFRLKNKNEYHFISLNDENYNLRLISVFSEFLSQKENNIAKYESKSFFIHVEIETDNYANIQEKILKNQSELASFIHVFNRYKLISQKFIEDYPITKYMGSLIDFDNGAIINEEENGYSKNVNVVFLGFGRVNKELFKASSTNDQIPSYNPKIKVVKNHLINYYAFDNELSFKIDKNEMYYEKRFAYYEKDFNNKEYFEKPENVCNFYREEMDVCSENFYKRIVEIVKAKKEQYTSVVVSLKDDLYNVDYALKLVKLFEELDVTSYHIFVRIKEHNDETINLLKDKNITFFGWDESVINHEIIVKDDLFEIAKITNSNYSGKRLVDTNWYKLSPIKQKSNLFSSLNMRLKLNLLGFDYYKTDRSVDNSELLKILEEKITFKVENYDDYLFFKNKKEPSVAQIIAFQEHSRWNAFYISQGYIPLKKTEIKLIDAENYCFIKDDNVKRKHACLTTYEGLNEYHHLLANLLCDANNKSLEENLKMVETYRYDFDLIDAFNKIFSSKYVLCRLK